MEQRSRGHSRGERGKPLVLKLSDDTLAIIAIIVITIICALTFPPPRRGGVVDKLPNDCWSEPEESR